jgi:hypothetical protein
MPSSLLAELLLANCQQLRRHLALLSKEGEAGGAAPDSRTASTATSHPAAELLGCEIFSVFEDIGLDVTEPALRAVEELIAANRKRNAEHWVRIRAEEEEQERQIRASHILAFLPESPSLRIIGNNNGAIAINMKEGAVLNVFNPTVGRWTGVGRGAVVGAAAARERNRDRQPALHPGDAGGPAEPAGAAGPRRRSRGEDEFEDELDDEDDDEDEEEDSTEEEEDDDE